MSFLKAEWRKLVLANYEVEPSLLSEYLPQHTELDFWNGRCYVSLVGFLFQNVRIKGVAVPFHTEFEEVNLRFYARHQSEGKWKRGVVFVNEFVPRRAISFVANAIYNERYKRLPMYHEWGKNPASQSVKYGWFMGNQWHSLQVESDLESRPIEAGSEAEFITEHYWGYSKRSHDLTIEYEVTHPKWEVYEVNKHIVTTDFGICYGHNFRFLNEQSPISVMLAEGSKITVENRRLI